MVSDVSQLKLSQISKFQKNIIVTNNKQKTTNKSIVSKIKVTPKPGIVVPKNGSPNKNSIIIKKIPIQNSVVKKKSQVKIKKESISKIPKVLSIQKSISGANNATAILRKLIPLKTKVNDAINGGKIFSVSQRYPDLRKEMVNRGWIEKFTEEKNLNISSLTLRDFAHNEPKILSALIQNAPNFVYHYMKNHPLCEKNGICINTINIGKEKDFNSKDGMYRCSMDKASAFIKNVAELNCPLTFVMDYQNDIEDFIYYFRLLLGRNFVTFLDGNQKKISFIDKQNEAFNVIITSSLIEFVCLFINAESERIQQQTDVDNTSRNKASEKDGKKWCEFISKYNEIVIKQENFRILLDATHKKKKIVKMVNIYYSKS